MNLPAWLQQAGAHERPWWLKTNEEAGRVRPGVGPYELPWDIADLVERGHKITPRPNDGVKTVISSKRTVHIKEKRGEHSPASGSSKPPPSPHTHMRALDAKVLQPLDVTPCDEFNRCFYFPGNSLKCKPGKLVEKGACRGPEAKQGLGRRPKVYGSYDSDYGKSNRDVDTGWKLDAIRRQRSEPGFGSRPHRLNPSMVSHGVTTSMVGGTHICLKRNFHKSMLRDEKRQHAQYEDSFRNWRGNYISPEFGLSQSDITEFGGMMVQQKILMRK